MWVRVQPLLCVAGSTYKAWKKSYCAAVMAAVHMLVYEPTWNEVSCWTHEHVNAHVLVWSMDQEPITSSQESMKFHWENCICLSSLVPPFCILPPLLFLLNSVWSLKEGRMGWTILICDGNDFDESVFIDWMKLLHGLDAVVLKNWEIG